MLERLGQLVHVYVEKFQSTVGSHELLDAVVAATTVQATGSGSGQCGRPMILGLYKDTTLKALRGKAAILPTLRRTVNA